MSATRPEVLAPAGDEECLRAAVGAGADAVYFGLSAGFNARAKAPGIAAEQLSRIFDFMHGRGVKGYVTFNTLVYDSELAAAESFLARIADAGADAVIVQDLGIAQLAHAQTPELPLHASTQMTLTSPQAAEVAKSLGVTRVILPRELSIAEIRRYRESSHLELECFVHGALCASYSGQCLASEAWGQRSANRGQCAQPCRLPYDLIVDGRRKSLGLQRYLLSPKDLAAHNHIEQLVDTGVVAFKIEGRYKGPEYVAATVEKYRRLVDAVMDNRRPELSPDDMEDLALTFSRGFSSGWLAGTDHQELSHGLYPGHRGLRVGRVERVQGFSVTVRLETGAPQVKAGDWMVFDQGEPEGDEPRGGVFSVAAGRDGRLDVRFGDPGPDLDRVSPGDILWKSHDSRRKRRLLRVASQERKLPVDMVVCGRADAPLDVLLTDALGRTARASTVEPLQPARHRPLDEALLREKLGAFGTSPFALRRLDVEIRGAVAIDPKELKRLRRTLVDILETQEVPRPHYVTQPVVSNGQRSLQPRAVGGDPPTAIPLCRTLDQVAAALDLGLPEIILDFMGLVGLAEAVRTCRQRGARVVIATPRIQKPGEEPIDRRLKALAPDAILARHLGAVHHYGGIAGAAFELHGDFSLNVSNSVTANILLDMGLTTLTPAYDLNFAQLEQLAANLEPSRLEITVHQHLPLYHSEYCLYARHLSQGRDFHTCGRPCEQHRLELGDGRQQTHPVLVDVGCRNTVFNAAAQSAAQHVARLVGLGVARLRVELVWESADETRRVLQAYGDLLQQKRTPTQVCRELGSMKRCSGPRRQ